MMLLQRQPPAGLDDDALDLVALAIVDRLIGTPGPMHLDVLFGDLGATVFSFATSRFNPLASF